MKILEKYIGRSVAISVFAVVVVLSSIVMLTGVAGEFDIIGTADYTIFTSLKLTLLLLPDRIYMFFPLAVLLGSILGLGALAKSSELVVVRAAGVSVFRIVLAVMKTALILIVFDFVIGEIIAPPALQYSTQQRVKALSKDVSLNTQYGLWARDGNTYIHVQRADNQGKLFNVYLYSYDSKHALEQILYAKTADYDGEQWQLTDIEKTDISFEKITISKVASMRWKTLLDPDIVSIVTFDPSKLSIWKLVSYIRYLRDNGLDTGQYELAFWSKVVMPFTIAAMVLLAVPYILGSLRRTSVGQQIVIGFITGLVFFIANRLFGQMSIVYSFPPLLGASLPTLLVFIGAFFLFKRNT